jgi:hypothetical protein
MPTSISLTSMHRIAGSHVCWCLYAQDELVQALRSDGRRQAAQRMLRAKRDSGFYDRTPDSD